MRPLARDEESVDLFGGSGTLELLAVQQLGLDDFEGLAGLGKLFGALAVTAAIAGGDQVSDTGGFVGESAMSVELRERAFTTILVWGGT